jgi:hypothetical protein
MTLFKLTLQELWKRRVNFLLGVLSVLMATAVLSGSILLLGAHDRRTDEILAAKQAELETQVERLRQDTVRAMEHLGFNVTILPAGQSLGDWYADKTAAQTMPQGDFDRLKASGLKTLDRLEPVLRRKVRWPETQWTVLIAGLGGEAAPPEGMVDIGDEIARGLNLNPGDPLELMGRSFVIRNRMKQEGAVEDITLTLSLSAAQTLLDAEGKISEIRAGQRRVAWQDIERIRADVRRVLPGTQIIEDGSKVLTKVTAIRQVEEKGAAQIENERMARAQMRQSVQRMLAILLPFILLACVAWIYLLAADNAARRTVEIGTLRSLGFSAGSVAKLFVFRSLLTGLVGGAAGLLVCAAFSGGMPGRLFILLLPLALLIALAGSIIPVRRAVNRDPADILRGES